MPTETRVREMQALDPNHSAVSKLVDHLRSMENALMSQAAQFQQFRVWLKRLVEKTPEVAIRLHEDENFQRYVNERLNKPTVG